MHSVTTILGWPSCPVLVPYGRSSFMMYFRIACISGHHNGRFLGIVRLPNYSYDRWYGLRGEGPSTLRTRYTAQVLSALTLPEPRATAQLLQLQEDQQGEFRAAASSCGIMRVTAASGSTRLISRLMLGSSHPTFFFFFVWYLKRCFNALVNDTTVVDLA